MVLRTRFFVIGLSLLALILVINLVRTRKLKEEFAILWLFTGVTLVMVPVFIDVLDFISFALGIEYPPAFIFLIALLGITFILFQFSVSISRYSDQIKVLTQEFAILRHRIQELEQKQRSSPGGPPAHRDLDVAPQATNPDPAESTQ
jgi:hypothetical protein